MSWLQTLILATALLVVGLGLGNAQTAISDYKLSSAGNGSWTWVVRSDGKLWFCDTRLYQISCYPSYDLNN
jgi:hypothetical protein